MQLAVAKLLVVDVGFLLPFTRQLLDAGQIPTLFFVLSDFSENRLSRFRVLVKVLDQGVSHKLHHP